MLIQGKLLTYGDDLSEVKNIRKNVFVKEMNFPEDIVSDELDSEAINVIVYEGADNKIPVATGRIIYDGSICCIDNIAVLEEYRNKYYGDFTIRMLLSKAFTAGVNQVMVDSLESSVGFFENIGFSRTGETYFKEQKEYIKMMVTAGNITSLCNKNKLI